MMRENGVKKIWASGGAVLNGWLSIPSAFSAEVNAHVGWDSLTVDLQHGVQDYLSLVPILQAISTTAVTPLVRVPANEPGIIMKCLDAGAYGVICPMVNTRQDAEQLVDWCRYPPAGKRSFGPIRASLYGGPEYAWCANDTIAVIPMIETEEAVRNLEAILSVPGIDGLYVGPVDLALSMGLPGALDPTEPAVLKAVDQILHAGKAHHVYAGVHCATPENAVRMIKRGFQFVSVINDSGFMTTAASACLGAIRQGIGTVSA
jgi:4-hydroxy-2-oxoheptanedioate aldolase